MSIDTVYTKYLCMYRHIYIWYVYLCVPYQLFTEVS